ncbi:MAG TPA: S8 family serine peptidase [Gammaproteobacteria bacterium]|nr:S8 family serine peptidase [Gammaproteobacteria bacterium]
MYKSSHPSSAKNTFLSLLGIALFTLTGCGGGGGGGVAGSTPSSIGFTVSGTLQAAGGNAVDSDVNDPFAPYAGNDSIATAQAIPNPVVVGGYLNEPGAGPAGRSRTIGDTTDFYRITLTANQLVILNIVDHAAADLDLFLYDSNNAIVASSTGTLATEILTAPATGTYTLRVAIFPTVIAGASGYTLTLGQQLTTAIAADLRLEDDFIPGEIIARFKPGSGAGKATAGTLAATGLAQKAGASDRPVLLTVPAPGTTSAAAGGTMARALPGDSRLQHKWETIRAIKQLRQRPDIEYAEPNYRRMPTLVPDDTNYPLQWHYPLINLPQAWDITTGAVTVVVAVVDTGILAGHPDLQGQVGQGYDFISDVANALDGNGIDADPEDPGDAGVAGNSSFHGTHVAGTVAAATGNATGVAGASWATTLMPLRALGLNGGTTYDIMQSLLYAAQLPNDSGGIPAQRADVINLSLGGYSFSQTEQDIINQVRNQGVMIVAAAGNDVSSNPFYPASYNGVISVSAVDINRLAAPYSNFGAQIDIAAPGGDTATDINGDGYPDGVLSTSGDDSTGSIQYLYRFLQGTSMAAPHVAGALALMKAAMPTLTPADVDNLLLNGQMTTDLGSPGRDNIYGHGLIDAHKAVVAALGGISPVPPTLVASPSALNFSTLGTTALLTVANGGGGTLSVNPPTDDASWLSVTPGAIDPGTGAGTYIVSVSRTGLAENIYTATITITTSSANTVQIPVIMQVSTLSQDADAGYQYVLLIDQATGTPRYQTGVAASNGTYQYSISGVAAGTYELMAGSDLDNDGTICVSGESCGAYISLDQPTPVTVNGNVTGRDFTTGFNVIINAAARQAGASGVARPAVKQVGP